MFLKIVLGWDKHSWEIIKVEMLGLEREERKGKKNNIPGRKGSHYLFSMYSKDDMPIQTEPQDWMQWLGVSENIQGTDNVYGSGTEGGQ